MKNIFLTALGTILLTAGLYAQHTIPVGSIASPSEYEVKNIEELNSGELDFCAVPFRKGLVFTSTRKPGSLFACSKDFAKGHYSDLYYAEKDAEGVYMPAELLPGDISGKYHDGASSFTSDETIMFFSRNNKKGTNSWGNIDLKIYEAKLKNGLWTEAKELPFNSNDFDNCHPSITPNGAWLYFASNRPGGFGGMDIYVVERSKSGSWGQPVNLGSKVNTAGNEIFPFISPEGVLYWSSDGFGGMGGLDIFSIPISNGEEAVRNLLSEPINSSSDDFAFTTNFEGTEGFLTSDREGGLGKDDIYSWKFLGQKPKLANICVVDEKTGYRISDAYLDLQLKPVENRKNGLTSINGMNYMQMEAMNVDGKEYLIMVPYKDDKAAPKLNTKNEKSCGLRLPIIPGRMYDVIVDKPGYQPLKKTVRAEEILANEEWLIPIKNMPPLAMKGTVKDGANELPIPLADVKVINSCTGEEMDILSDRNGDFTFPMDCNCDYEIIASKGEYRYDYEMLYSYDIQCNKENTTVLLYLEKEPKPEFSVGEVIKLEDVYYDYDKFYIRSDAAAELDKVVNFMRKYPSLELELRSHTDSRGSYEYNRKLSQNRAQAAVDYIISRGISSSRIVAAGYGESQLVNHCADGVPCSEAEHQENRRTEIKVTKFNEKGVRVED
ncbi:MAG TPA: hypothetical protein ENJ95_09155 [Bacteroidetes bacterium]|nr:hypothetical protein [Bacteroidota bacterium]